MRAVVPLRANRRNLDSSRLTWHIVRKTVRRFRPSSAADRGLGGCNPIHSHKRSLAGGLHTAQAPQPSHIIETLTKMCGISPRLSLSFSPPPPQTISRAHHAALGCCARALRRGIDQANSRALLCEACTDSARLPSRQEIRHNPRNFAKILSLPPSSPPLSSLSGLNKAAPSPLAPRPGPSGGTEPGSHFTSVGIFVRSLGGWRTRGADRLVGVGWVGGGNGRIEPPGPPSRAELARHSIHHSHSPTFKVREGGRDSSGVWESGGRWGPHGGLCGSPTHQLVDGAGLPPFAVGAPHSQPLTRENSLGLKMENVVAQKFATSPVLELCRALDLS